MNYLNQCFRISAVSECAKRWSRWVAAVIVTASCGQALAQFGDGTSTLWVGPDLDCDHATLQEAVDEISCQVAGCTKQINVSQSYMHDDSTVLIDKSLSIKGGWGACRGSNNPSARSGIFHPFDATGSVFSIEPGAGSLKVQLSQLSMKGSLVQSNAGGVILVEAGDAKVTLDNSLVFNGHAGFGGGIAMRGEGNELVIRDSVVRDSRARVGAGIHCTGGGRINFISGEVADNEAELSGGGFALESSCELVGSSAGENRLILRNKVTDRQSGQGGGIFATGFSTIAMGALNSRTVIQGNEVEWRLPLHNYDAPGDNRGGGVHLSFADATFYNTWFRENQAADGGAVSVVGLSTLLVDRYPGPCVSGDPIKDWECSLFDFNHARGGRDDEGEEGGDGAVLYAADLFGQSPQVAISRSTIRFNRASCFEALAPDQTGQCDVDFGFGDVTDSSIVYGVDLQFRGNLMMDNDIGDDDDPFGSGFKFGSYFVLRGEATLSQNTISGNADSDFVVARPRPAKDSDVLDLINNIVMNNGADEFARGNFRLVPANIGTASCNVSEYATELTAEADSIPIPNVDEDPLFLDPDTSDRFQADYRISVPDSPAIDRCDDGGGLATLAYDIVGNPRPLNVPATTNGPGERDVGAFEALRPGYDNDTTDLRVDVVSDSPKQVDLGQVHAFRIDVSNVGANAPGEVTVTLNLADDAQLLSLSSPSGSGPFDPPAFWDCETTTRRCTGPGAGSDTITARVAHDLPGLAEVSATATSVEPEISPTNNTASDTVLVGTGADLSITATSNTAPADQEKRIEVVVSNAGPDAVDVGEMMLSIIANPTPGAYAFAAGDWTCVEPSSDPCTFDGVLLPLPGEEALLELVLTYDDVIGDITVDFELFTTADFTDPNAENNQATVTLSIPNPVEEVFSDGFETTP